MRVGIARESLWEALVRADETATFFQTPAWHKLAGDFEGTRGHPLLFDFGDAQAVFPLQRRKRPWGDLLTAPFGTYATLLCAAELRPGRLESVAGALSGLNVDIPGSPFSRRLPEAGRAPVSQTRVLRLEDLDPETWVAAWSRNHRRLLRDAREAGFSVRFAESAADVSGYYAVYRGQTERWGSAARRTYPEELFQEAFRRFVPARAMRLWLAESGGEIVAGRLCFHHGFHAVEWHAAAARDAMERGVNHLLVHTAVLHARESGFKVYDFNPNPGLDAVDHFKRGFASELLAFRGARHRTGLAGKLAGLRDRFRAGR